MAFFGLFVLMYAIQILVGCKTRAPRPGAVLGLQCNIFVFRTFWLKYDLFAWVKLIKSSLEIHGV